MTDNTFAIIFDLDGVLLDSESDMTWMKQALIDTLQAFNIETTEENISMLDGKNLSKFPEIASYFQVDVKELWRIRNHITQNGNEKLSIQIKFNHFQM